MFEAGALREHLGSLSEDQERSQVSRCGWLKAREMAGSAGTENPHGCGSKPCTPGEHQNRWPTDVHPSQNGIAIGYAPGPHEDRKPF